jgi:hypothetical protein
MRHRYKYQTGGEQEQSWMDMIGSYIPSISEYYNKVVNYFDEPDNFNEAFSRARAAGEPTFVFEGKEYNTALKKEAPAPKQKVTKSAAKKANLALISPEIFLRQGFMESRFKPSVVSGKEKSRVGAMGLAQLMPKTIESYRKAHPDEEFDPYNPEHSVKAQKWFMNWLSERPYLNKPGQPANVTIAKVLGAYNWGPGNMKTFLEGQKAKGVDIYNSMDWVKNLDEEPRKYIQGILLNEIPSFQQEIERDTVDSPYNKYYGFKRSGGQVINPLAQLYMEQMGGTAKVSSRGQWDYPGQDTMVPTPDGRITMQGVPYPVYGQDETGYGQMMYPGGEYQYPGQMVYETPMMQKGGQKEIQEQRYKQLYVPLIDKVVKGAGEDWEMLPLSNTSFVESLFSGSVEGRNLPPMDPVIQEIQSKILSLPNEEINRLMKVEWKNISAPRALWEKPDQISYPDMLKYIKHVKELKGKGYTMQQGGSYKEWKEKYGLSESLDYNLKRAWKLGYTPDSEGHLPTVDYKTGKFLKSRNHPTIGLELEWFNSPDAKEFRQGHRIDSTGKYFKYVPNKPMMQDGSEVKFWQSLDPREWGLMDYSNKENFNTAFKTADKAGNKEFVYKGKRYTTEKVPKSESDAYWDSKNFLKEYYRTQPFVTPESYKHQSELKDAYLLKKYGKSYRELLKSDDRSEKDWALLVDMMKDNHNIYNNADDAFSQYAIEQIGKKRIDLLDRPAYFSITTQKGDLKQDGHWMPKENKIFVSVPEPNKLNTTYVHELAHKSASTAFTSEMNIPEIDIDAMLDANRGMNINEDSYIYLLNPQEIDARKMSALYYLNKSNKPWKSGTIRKQDLADLYEADAQGKLPYDVSQLLLVFRAQPNDLLKYLNNEYTPVQRKQMGGPLQNFYEQNMMKNGGQHGGLDRWFAEKWVDIKTGKPCGRQEGENRSYPACRPSRRVSSETPKTRSEMSPSEKAKFKQTKTSSARIPYNHKRN